MRVTRRGFYWRRLPHLQRDYKPHFVTFCTYQRWILPELARATVLECCSHDHEVTMTLHACIVMPDHVHLIFTPRVMRSAKKSVPWPRIMDAIKGVSPHKINKTLGREGRVWQSESFDRVLRSSESLDAKIAYVLANPVRAGLAGVPAEYPWLWQKAEPRPSGGCLMTRRARGKSTAELRSARQPRAAVATWSPSPPDSRRYTAFATCRSPLVNQGALGLPLN